MTYPGGAPGGYPGPGPQQPPQGYGPAPAGGTKQGVPHILYLVVAGVGVLNFLLGFVNVGGGVNFFDGASLLPGMFLIAGLIAAKVALPFEDRKPGILPAVISVAATLTVLFALFNGAGTGAVLLTVFGFVQSAAAVVALLMDEGVIKPPQPSHHVPYGQPGGYNPPSGQFGQQQQPLGQPGQQPPPGQFGQPPHGQQTTFAPQQGQFGQQHPGTPPGGYPQQQG